MRDNLEGPTLTLYYTTNGGIDMLKKLLFETRLGDLVLALFERLFGLAVVDLGQLEARAD